MKARWGFRRLKSTKTARACGAHRGAGTLLAALAVAALCLAGCNPVRKGYLERLRDLEKGPSGASSSASIEELRRGIARFQGEVDRQVKAAQNLGIYYKMLALKYMDAGIYGLALENLRKAIEIYPENSQLFYYSAVASARMAKAEVTDAAAAAQGLARAEAFYQRAIFLDPGYVNALYGLAVLNALELSRPGQAELLLDQVLAREKKNIDALALLARLRYAGGRLEEAAELYQRIADSTQAPRLKSQALANKRTIEEELYARK
jgi:tetratricopeptide (TPR) repeat protein